MDDRPLWNIPEISEADFRRIVALGRITSVRATVEMTSADTSEEWLEASGDDGEFVRLPNRWAKVLEFEGSWTNPGLFGLNYLGLKARDRLLEIDEWEKANEEDRREFERLKKKFEACR